MQITLCLNGKKLKQECKSNESLLCALRRAGVCFSAPCSGKGTCGKCKVKLNCFTEPTETEKKLLTEKEILQNIRLACRTYPKDGMEIEPVSEFTPVSTAQVEEKTTESASLRAIADIGTTTVTVGFTDEKGNIVNVKSENNAQSAYGADVISRIEGDTAAQHKLIIQQLKRMINGKADTLYTCGNTAMLHILLNEDCSGLKHHPYKPDFLDSQQKKFENFDIITLPCMSEFIGADITAGIIAARPEKRYKLLIDLGTNAEIALFNEDKIFASSAAAGPAFEGANISCGMAATDGAICSFSFENNMKNISTVNSAAPAGICGSGLLDIVAALRGRGIIEENGRIDAGSYNITGDIVITTQDVHEFMLAKAAVRTGTDMLLHKAGITADDIKEVILSGGFGTYLNPVSAAITGLLDSALAAKASFAGNTALCGTAMWVSGIRTLPQNVEILPLATDPEFSERFIENISL